VSMVRADLMDAVDYSLRVNIKKNKPFGGLQVILMGDLFQLPPIVKEAELKNHFKSRYGGHYFFNAHVFNKSRPRYFELTQIYRQKEKDFIELLNRIRRNDVVERDLAVLNQRVNKDTRDNWKDPHLVLTTTNQLADRTNIQRLSELDGEAFDYVAEVTGEFKSSSYPTNYELRLKKGAQVMFVKNDKGKRWINGTIAVINDISQDSIRVETNGTVHEVHRELWKNNRYCTDSSTGMLIKESVGTFMQYPLRLAWAITIHKSQGHTFDKTIIDLGNGAFAHGQTYVALSRCRTLEGISLRRAVRRRDIIIDKSIHGASDKFIAA